MKLTVWKFELRLDDEIEVRMPHGARLLDVQEQDDRPCLWALVDPRAEVNVRRFRIAGTGHPIADAEQLVYVGTFQLRAGALVFHLFERMPTEVA